jgi:diguanylate cyclase (GGDEF)-like protein/PAS domain S-box-containing protein
VAATPVDQLDGALQGAVMEGSPDLQAVTSLDGVYRFVAASSLAHFGWRPEDLLHANQDSFAHPDDVAAVSQGRLDVARRPAEVVAVVSRFRCADGGYRWVETLSRMVLLGDEKVIVSAVRDIAMRKEAEEDLRRMASTDPLTGVANRTVFMDRLHQALRRLERRDGLVAVLFLDLDRFKLINDSVGHVIGDAVLLQMATRLLAFLRPQDTLARLGGDEFAIVAEGMEWAGQAVTLAERIVDAGRAPFTVGAESFICTTSVGVAVTSDPQRSAEGILQEADLALYRAKDRGRNRAEVFDEDLRSRAVGRLGTERMLRRAIDESRLRLHYQPIIDLSTGDTVAVEALIRLWDAEGERLIAAEEFIEVAEETGLLATMDDWVLDQAVEQATSWGPLFQGSSFADIAINLTARQLANSGFAEGLVDLLGDHGLPAGAFQIEVTERVLMEASNSAMNGLRVLRTAGVKVGLDDFGTGYSSLSYLRLFPLDFVKVDRSFICALGWGTTERAIVASIIELAHALDMEVVAEGVETASQLEQLQALGCDRAQGYLIAAPGPALLVENRVLQRGA